MILIITVALVIITNLQIPAFTGKEVPAANTMADFDSPRERVSFNAGWLFDRFGFMPDGSIRDEAAGLENPEFYDSDWHNLHRQD